MFGSGANHGVYIQFIAHSCAFNDEKIIGLLCGAGTRFSTWFYAMHKALRMKPVLAATIHNASFASLSKNDQVASVIKYIEDEFFGRQFIVFLVLFSLH